LAKVLDTINLSQKDLAARIDVTEKHISEIVQCKSSITSDMALKFEYATGISASFWLGLQKNYEEILARNDMDVAVKQETELAKKYPHKDMVSFGWISKPTSPLDLVDQLLKFFGVDSLLLVPTVYSSAFRKSSVATAKPESVAVWLRQGWRMSNEQKTDEFSRERIIAFLPEFKKMTEMKLTDALPALTEKCRQCGIALVVMHQPAGAPVNGTTQWLSKEKVLIQLSLRYSYADIFWFTFFHELGHILKHGKKAIYIDFSKGISNTNIEFEKDADQFASTNLISSVAYQQLCTETNISAKQIVDLSTKEGVHPGIIVGRLQHDKKILYSHLNQLRERYCWKS
jgi:HTH-type transcriptional regulator/antitoxin HigA